MPRPLHTPFLSSSSNPSAAGARVEAGRAERQVRSARLERRHVVQASLPPGGAPGKVALRMSVLRVAEAWRGGRRGALHLRQLNALQGAAGSDCKSKECAPLREGEQRSRQEDQALET